MSHSIMMPSIGQSYSTQPQADVKTVIARTEATQLLLLNSKNRNQTSSTGQISNQPWNRFRLERPQALMESFATRIAVTEIRFPWYIPNITTYNNSLWVTAEANLPGAPITTYPVVFPTGFYTPADIVTIFNDTVNATTMLHPPVMSYNAGQYRIAQSDITLVGNFNVYWYNPYQNLVAPSETAYNTSSSLCQTLGFVFQQVSGVGPSPPLFLSDIIGNVTETLYTQYVDIVSEKLNYYSHTKDGSSDGATSKSLVCRVFLADEVSLDSNAGIGQTPFIIHRQFKTPKNLMWNKESVIDQLDISVIDQYGQLVPLPFIHQVNPGFSPQGAYPDFQITLTASEN